MTGKYNKLIESYCTSRGIAVPIGFARASASRYAAIDIDCDPPKLVARTWFKMEDLVYFLRNLAGDQHFCLLDFKDGVELVDEGGKRLKRGGPLDAT